MDSATEQYWKNGLLIALDRDRAKQLFAAKTADLLEEFFTTCCQDTAFVDSQMVVDCGGNWAVLKEELTATCESADDDVRPLLQLMIDGFRPLLDEPDSFLVRPDLVPQIAAVLDGIDTAGLVQGRELFEQIKVAYQKAAAERCAITMFYRR